MPDIGYRHQGETEAMGFGIRESKLKFFPTMLSQNLAYFLILEQEF